MRPAGRLFGGDLLAEDIRGNQVIEEIARMLTRRLLEEKKTRWRNNGGG
jgi:hypothetical protein